MENYVIRFNEAEREAVIDILSRSNDIIINKVEEASVGITIQLDDSDAAYRELMEQIQRELHSPVTIETFVTDGSQGDNASFSQKDPNSGIDPRGHIQ